MNSEKNSKTKKQKKRLFDNFFYDFVKITGLIPSLIWIRPKILRPYGTKTPKGKILVSANHKNLLDPIIVQSVFPSRRLHCLATKDLFNTKTKHFFFSKVNCIIVDKENFTMSAFREVMTKLEEEKMVVIFPEGSIDLGKDDSIRAFKSGAVLMAHKANSAILPLYIARREKWYHRQYIVVGEPFDIRGEIGNVPTLDALNGATEKLRQKELELREYYESTVASKKSKKESSEESEKENAYGKQI